MGISLSILLLAVGAVLAFAVDAKASGIDMLACRFSTARAAAPGRCATTPSRLALEAPLAARRAADPFTPAPTLPAARPTTSSSVCVAGGA
jgi:hypothetical protein